MEALSFAPVTPETWPDFERLFEAPGSPKNCWCTVWRPMADRQSASSADKKRLMEKTVFSETPVGLLAYEDSEPIGWCSVAPRDSLRKLGPGQTIDPKVWSMVCLFIRKSHQRKRIAPALLDAAVNHAFAEGAETVEAYPVDPDSPSYRFMGFRDMFCARGFIEIGMAGTRRHVMQLSRR